MGTECDHHDAADTCPTPSTPVESFTYDADGNLTGDGTYTYAWDAENRLVEVETVSPSYGDLKLVFKYDYRSRRVAKETYHWDGTQWDTNTSDDLELYVYDEWNVVLIFLEASNKPVRRKYTWGLDLSGLSGAGVGPASSRSTDGMHSAGGIGGLLATVETQGTSSTTDDDNYWHFYDGNGNVGQLLEYDATGDTVSTTPAAHYEYDPYGQLIRSTGDYADINPFRFSTKWFEADFGIGCWPYRWYWLRDGRWGSRDPLGEVGGFNIYACMANALIARYDAFGLAWGDNPCRECLTMCENTEPSNAKNCLSFCREAGACPPPPPPPPPPPLCTICPGKYRRCIQDAAALSTQCGLRSIIVCGAACWKWKNAPWCTACEVAYVYACSKQLSNDNDYCWCMYQNCMKGNSDDAADCPNPMGSIPNPRFE